MQRHGAEVGLPLLLALDEGFLLTSESQPPPSNSGAVLLLLVALCSGANLLGRVSPRAVGYIAVSPSAAAGDVLPGWFLLFCVEPLMCAVALPGCKCRGHGQFGPRLHLLPGGPAVHGDVLRVREQRGREHYWLDRHEPEHG
jgi:hypothetical protein